MKYIVIALETDDDKLVQLYASRISSMIKCWNHARGEKMKIHLEKAKTPTVYRKALTAESLVEAAQALSGRHH